MYSMGYPFNSDDCSINNLVWTPVAKVDESLTKRETEAELKKLETIIIAMG